MPATSANLGPGFDSLGIALGLYDAVQVRAVTGATTVVVDGHGAAELDGGEDHLVVRAIRAGLDEAGAPQAGLELRCVNGIPQGRGLGSSAAAVVAGLVAARGMISEPEALDDDVVLRIASDWESHPDNAAAALLGGATLAWTSGATARAVRLAVADGLVPTVLIPGARLLTSAARAVLPPRVPHGDAAFNAARAALLVVALDSRPELLFDATADRLHQDYRGEVMGPTLEIVRSLRAAGLPAVVSGAGPSVLVLAEVPSEHAVPLRAAGWQIVTPGLDLGGVLLA